MLAAHAAAAILAARHSEQLESALSTRDRIGQAKGIIMERYGVDDVRAFEMLRRLSQDANTKLAESRSGSSTRAATDYSSARTAPAVPVAEQQRDFDVEAAIDDRSAATLDRAVHAIFDGVGVQMEFLGGGLEA